LSNTNPTKTVMNLGAPEGQ